MQHHGTAARERLPLHDDVALDEIELYAEVLIAVADTDRPLRPAEIDRILGLPTAPGPSAVVPPCRQELSSWTGHASGNGSAWTGDW